MSMAVWEVAVAITACLSVCLLSLPGSIKSSEIQRRTRREEEERGVRYYQSYSTRRVQLVVRTRAEQLAALPPRSTTRYTHSSYSSDFSQLLIQTVSHMYKHKKTQEALHTDRSMHALLAPIRSFTTNDQLKFKHQEPLLTKKKRKLKPHENTARGEELIREQQLKLR